MTETPDIAESEAPRVDPNALRDADDHLNPLWVERLRAHLNDSDTTEIADLTADLHAADMGDLLEALDADERVRLVTILGDKFDFSALTEVDDTVRTELIEDLPAATTPSTSLRTSTSRSARKSSRRCRPSSG
jgi:magnesium transporter